MKKKANRRAFFVCVFICLMYASVAAKIPEKLSFIRTSGSHNSGSKSMGLALPESTQKTVEKVEPVKAVAAAPRVSQKTAQNPAADDDMIEPSLLISVPLVCYALSEKIIEKDGMVPSDKDNNNNSVWKKPLDILRDRDEEGLKNISKSIGTNRMLNFLKKEGIVLKEKLSEEDMMLGKGYFVEKKKLLAIYGSHVKDDYERLFPLVVSGTGIARHNGNYVFVHMKSDPKHQYVKDDKEWLMPNLTNLPSKAALEKLITHTSKIKVVGSGNIVDQSPKPFERIRGEAECVIYGKNLR